MIVTGLSAFLCLDTRNLGQDRATLLGRGYAATYNDEGATGSQQYRAELDLRGSVTGSVVDEVDAPITGVEVELIPVAKVGDQRWFATKHEWTDAKGGYAFPDVDPGEYIVAVQKRGAPDGQHPFAGTYYPGVDAEMDADRIDVVTSSTSELHPLKLRRIDTVALKISVEFADGSRPTWSNLLFHNVSFPDQAVISDEAPGIENGQGEITLPVGFDYYAQAKVDCAGGERIETRESRPVHRLHIAENDIEEIRFIIPGPPCQLWSPK